MAQGQKVALTRRVYVNADKSAAVAYDSPDAVWFLGGDGHVIDKDLAVSLGLVEDEDFGPIPNAMDAILEQEAKNRATHAVSSAVVMHPAPIATATTPDRLAYDRGTGQPIDGHPDANLDSSSSMIDDLENDEEDDEGDEDEEDDETVAAKPTTTRGSARAVHGRAIPETKQKPVPENKELHPSDTKGETQTESHSSPATTTTTSSLD